MKVDKEAVREVLETLEDEMERDVDSRLIDLAPEYKGAAKKEEEVGDDREP